MAQAIFKSWIVDFAPIRAKVEAKSVGRDPNRAAMVAIAGVSLEQDWDEVESALDQKLAGMTEEQRQQLARTAELFPDELVKLAKNQYPEMFDVWFEKVDQLHTEQFEQILDKIPEEFITDMARTFPGNF
jgi:type I restriction enzyme, S subunit